jgi:putative cardiolipin synthase
VRVRVLVDDLHSDGVDELLLGLAAFDNAEVRLFNPFVRRRGSQLWKLVSSLDELSRVNHRMHNKMLVADNAFAVFGGRNIGDNYFMRSPERNFIDLDILAAGPVVQALSASFDTYWNSEYAYSDRPGPAAGIGSARATRRIRRGARRDRAAAARSHRAAALSALRQGPRRPRWRIRAPGRGPRRAPCRFRSTRRRARA